MEAHRKIQAARVADRAVDGGNSLCRAARSDGQVAASATARTRGSTGTGLGLAIAQSLAERAGGRIEIVPSAAAGATFRLTLPVLG